MRKLLQKEFSLAMHPITPLMVLLSAMVLIPNYPYVVMFFYTSMAIFFTCLLGRENKDIVYSLNLPVAKRDIVKARFAFAAVVQFAQLALMIPLVLLSQRVNALGNQAGMDANISLFAVGFMVYGLFNLVFFCTYYRDVNKVGVAFVKSSVVIFVCATLDVVATYAVPFVKNGLDTRDPAFLSGKLLFLALGVLIYAVLTLLAYRVSAASFEKQDLN